MPVTLLPTKSIISRPGPENLGTWVHLDSLILEKLCFCWALGTSAPAISSGPILAITDSPTHLLQFLIFPQFFSPNISHRGPVSIAQNVQPWLLVGWEGVKGQNVEKRGHNPKQENILQVRHFCLHICLHKSFLKLNFPLIEPYSIRDNVEKKVKWHTISTP